LLDAFETVLGVAVLLGAAGDGVAVDAWSGPAWSALGRNLAGLHAVPVDGLDWSRPDPLLDAMSEPTDAITNFWGDVLPGLPDLLGSRDALRQELASQPTVLVHGDCHAGNILHAADGLVFCDWQSTGAGRATSDLAFLAARAAPAGVTPPNEVMTAYLNRCAGNVAQLQRALILEELAILVFQWPPFAAYHGQAAIARVHERTCYVAEKWLAMGRPTGLIHDGREAIGGLHHRAQRRNGFVSWVTNYYIGDDVRVLDNSRLHDQADSRRPAGSLPL
jgi:Ser/Thr protein kinase RdoA (MazF antagonist)